MKRAAPRYLEGREIWFRVRLSGIQSNASAELVEIRIVAWAGLGTIPNEIGGRKNFTLCFSNSPMSIANSNAVGRRCRQDGSESGKPQVKQTRPTFGTSLRSGSRERKANWKNG